MNSMQAIYIYCITYLIIKCSCKNKCEIFAFYKDQDPDILVIKAKCMQTDGF